MLALSLITTLNLAREEGRVQVAEIEYVRIYVETGLTESSGAFWARRKATNFNIFIILSSHFVHETGSSHTSQQYVREFN